MLTKFLVGILIFILSMKALGFIARWWLKRKLLKFMSKQAEQFSASMGGADTSTDTLSSQDEQVVRCLYCNTFVPQRTTISYHGKVFCSQAHASAYNAKKG